MTSLPDVFTPVGTDFVGETVNGFFQSHVWLCGPVGKNASGDFPPLQNPVLSKRRNLRVVVAQFPEQFVRVLTQ